jgi:hypothetical protein
MSTDRNPYAPSAASLDARVTQPELDSARASLWRDGDELVALSGSSLPRRCVKCNAAADEPTRIRQVYWCHPALYLLLPINLVIFGVLVLMLRRKAIVAPGLCAEHKRRHRRAVRLRWTGLLSGLVLSYVGAASPFGLWAMLLGVLIMLGAIVAGMVFARIVYAKRIDKTYVRLKGCEAPFLNSLPPFPG